MKFLDGFNWFFNPAWLASNVFTLYGGKGDAPAAPDYSQIAASQEKAAQYAKESADNDLAFRKEQYANSLPYQRQLYDLASQVAQQQLGTGSLAQQQQQEQWDTYQGQYSPIELQNVLDSVGQQYLSDDDIKQLTQSLINPQYDTTDIHSTREVPYYEDVANPNSGFTPLDKNEWAKQQVAPQDVWPGSFAPDQQQAFQIWQFQHAGNRPDTSDAAYAAYLSDHPAVAASPSQIQKFRTEDYVSGQNKTLNKDFQANQAALISSLSKKAQDNAAARASEGLEAQVQRGVDQQTRSLSRMGLNAGRLQANLADLSQNQALAGVNAQNQARNQVAAQQQNLRTGVANFGRNMPNTSNQSAGTSINAGSSAVGNQNTGFMSGLAYPQYVSGGVGNQINAAQLRSQGALGLGQLQTSAYTAGLNSNQDNFLGGALGLAGSLGSAYIMRGV